MEIGNLENLSGDVTGRVAVLRPERRRTLPKSGLPENKVEKPTSRADAQAGRRLTKEGHVLLKRGTGVE